MQTQEAEFQVISIEGNIGSGKSTLLSYLKGEYSENKKVIFLKEPVDEWESIVDAEGKTMIQKFYADQKKYSFPFQMMAYISRLNLLINAIEENPGAVIITERSLYTDKLVFAKMLYDSNMIEDVNYQIYLKWFDVFARKCPVHKIIYVNTSPEICHSRIAKRSRNGEDVIALDYLKNCHTYHENMINIELSNLFPHETLTLNGNVDITDDSNPLYIWLKQVGNFIHNGDTIWL
jgi:deoxyadenosine/deoxycytidine kinase